MTPMKRGLLVMARALTREGLTSTELRPSMRATRFWWAVRTVLLALAVVFMNDDAFAQASERAPESIDGDSVEDDEGAAHAQGIGEGSLPLGRRGEQCAHLSCERNRDP